MSLLFFIKGGNFHPIVSDKFSTTSFGAAALLIFYVFTGFESIAVAAEDMDNSQKKLPHAIIFVMTIVSIFYIFIQIVSIGVLGPRLTTATTLVQAAMTKFMGNGGLIIVAARELISIGGINIASSFITPRSAVALADDGLLPKFMKKRAKNNAQVWAIIIIGLITLPIALSGSFTTLAAISVVSRFAQYLPTCLSILVFHKTKKNIERPLKFHLDQ